MPLSLDAAKEAAAVLVSTPIFTNTCSRCLFIVLGLAAKISAMSLFVLPFVAQYKTSDSRFVSLKTAHNASICAPSDSSLSKTIHCS